MRLTRIEMLIVACVVGWATCLWLAYTYLE